MKRSRVGQGGRHNDFVTAERMGQSRFQKQNAKHLETIAHTELDVHPCFVWSEASASLFFDVERTRS